MNEDESTSPPTGWPAPPPRAPQHDGPASPGTRPEPSASLAPPTDTTAAGPSAPPSTGTEPARGEALISADRVVEVPADNPDGVWRPDPTGRHEGRWFVDGVPTKWVRDGGVRAEDTIEPGLQSHSQVADRRASDGAVFAFPAADPTPTPPSPPIAASASNESKSHTKVVALVGAVAVAAIIAVVAVVNLAGPTQKSRYLDSLDAAGLHSAFSSPDIAVSHAKSTCEKLDNGKHAMGTKADKIGVEAYCPKLLPNFKLRDDAYLDKLATEGLNGGFGTDAEAIAHAQKVCRGLKNGDPAQGESEDAIGVEIYCPQFSDGFKVLRTITVPGIFVLDDSDSLAYSDPETFGDTSGVMEAGGTCMGQGGYSDIGPGTAVTVKNAAGELLTTTELGAGSNTSPGVCEFTFSFQVKEGEDTYVVSVSHRGEASYSFADLESGGVQLSLGG